MNSLGGNVSIGLVYSNKKDNSLTSNHRKIIECLISNYKRKINSVKYCNDADGEDWVELNNISYSQIEFIEILVKRHYATLASSIELSNREIPVVISIDIL